MPACDPATLSALSGCLNSCLTHKQLLAARLYVACVEAGVTTDPKSLMQSASCLLCLTEKQIQAAQLYVECVGGGGSGGGGTGGVGPPTSPGTALYELYMDTTTPTQPIVYYWNGTTWVNFIGNGLNPAPVLTYAGGGTITWTSNFNPSNWTIQVVGGGKFSALGSARSATPGFPLGSQVYIYGLDGSSDTDTFNSNTVTIS